MSEPSTEEQEKLDEMVDMLVYSLQNSPGEWIVETYTVKHKSSGVEVWLGTDWQYCGIWRPNTLRKEELSNSQLKNLWKASQSVITSQKHTTTFLSAKKIIDMFEGREDDNEPIGKANCAIAYGDIVYGKNLDPVDDD